MSGASEADLSERQLGDAELREQAAAWAGQPEARIAFGTAGLRGPMGPGYHRMNELVVAQTAQGLLSYLQTHFDDLATRGVVVGFDGRHQSRLFARRTAAVLASRGVRVHLFGELVPTPLVSFGVRHLGARAGVMVTASHNPAADNGYKVYWANASQITAPHDKGIAAAILAHLDPWPVDVPALLASPLVVDPTAAVADRFYEAILQWRFHPELNASSDLKIVFTPMHGVGGKWVTRAFQAFGLKPFFPVMAQLYPDPDFPTVEFPNPEEGKGALKLAFETADRVGAPIVIANDPDSDRLAAAEKISNTDGWRVFSGNEIGTLLAAWTLSNYRRTHPDVDPSKLLFVNTTVSSKMIAHIAKAEGIHYEECLTGFKWIGDVALRFADKGYTLIFAFEQAIGYMIGDICPDKDGVRTAAVFAEMSNWLYSQNLTLAARLDQLYEQYGYMASRDHYFFCYDPAKMMSIFEDIKLENGEYPKTMGKYAISRIRDLKSPGFDSATDDKKPILPVGSSPMLTLFFENGAVFTLRGSGTEPKLKYYTELPGKRGEADDTLKDMIQEMVKLFLKPEENGLVAPKE